MDLTKDQRDAYGADGFLVMQGLFDRSFILELRERIESMARGEVGVPAGVATMQEPAVARDRVQTLEPVQRLRKLEGVALATDPILARAAKHPPLVGVMQAVVGQDLKLLRAAAMLKPPHVGSAKGLHQDAAYYPIEPLEHCAAWIALDPATSENGCMEVLPRAHRQGLRPHERREYETDVVVTGSDGREGGLVQLPMEPGDVLLTHCLTAHRSGPNRSDTWRRALIFGYVDARSRFTMPPAERPSWVASLPITGRSYPGAV